MGLVEKYEQKLQRTDALLIRQKMLGNITYTNNPHMLPYLILQKIMTFDYRRLPMLCASAPNEFGVTVDPNVDEETQIHPLDSFLALLHCSDNLLRQDMLSRLFTCQLAIPILLPDPCTKHITMLLWAMRSIVRGWKLVQVNPENSKMCPENSKVLPENHKKVKSKEQRIVEYNGPIISFTKIGNAKYKNCSKSQILNSVIGDLDYFFHWDCPGGDASRKFVDGLVEFCCYFPSGKPTDPFPDAVMFLNLRGEACDHPVQIKFFKEICLMSFVLLLDNNLNSSIIDVLTMLSSNPGGAVIIFPDYKETVRLENSQGLLKVMEKNGIAHLDIKGKNNAYIKTKIQQIISQKLRHANIKEFKTLADSAHTAHKLGIQTDEENNECIEGKKLAADVMKEFLNIKPTEAKARMLPLQGHELWHAWAKLDKQSYRLSYERKTVEHHNKSIDQQKRSIREKQFYPL